MSLEQLIVKFVSSDLYILNAWLRFMVDNGMVTMADIAEECEYQQFLQQAVEQAETIVTGGAR